MFILIFVIFNPHAPSRKLCSRTQASHEYITVLSHLKNYKFEGVVTLSHHPVGQERGILWQEVPNFFSKLMFYMNKTFQSRSLCNYQMLMRQNFDAMWSKLS